MTFFVLPGRCFSAVGQVLVCTVTPSSHPWGLPARDGQEGGAHLHPLPGWELDLAGMHPWEAGL